MPSLNNRVRDELFKIITDELGMVNARAEVLAKEYWNQAEVEVANNLGYSDAVTRVEFLKNQIEGLQTELSRLEGSLIEKGQLATPEDYATLGIDVSSNRYGQVYNRPYVFGREISTKWDVLVLERLNASLPFSVIYQGLAQLGHVVKRELLLCGNYEEARHLYQKFHSKVIEAIGDQMPGLLSDVRSMPALQRPFEKD